MQSFVNLIIVPTSKATLQEMSKSKFIYSLRSGGFSSTQFPLLFPSQNRRYAGQLIYLLI